MVKPCSSFAAMRRAGFLVVTAKRKLTQNLHQLLIAAKNAEIKLILNLPAPSSIRAFKRPDNVARNPTAVKIAFLRRDQLIIDKAGVHF